MRTMRKLKTAAVLVAALLGQSVYAAPALAAKSLDLKAMLTFAIEDERIARLEYEVIIERLGAVRPFSNIVRAEETHIQWLEGLFAGHGLAVPADTTSRPAAPANLVAALRAGREAEIDNIAMYDRFLAQDLPADVRRVFVQLKAASENHLRAFATNLGRSA